MSRDVAQQLRALFPTHERQLMELLAQREKEEQKRLKGLLRDKMREETKAIGALMRERIKELEKRLSEREKEQEGYQLALPGLEEERAQFQNDTEWMKRKLDHLREELEAEPERIKQRYALRGVRVFPLAVLYLMPRGML